MHLFIATEGVHLHTEEFVNELRKTYIPAPTPNQFKDMATKKGLEIMGHLTQVQVREMRFFDIVFPQESLDTVLKIIAPFGSPDSRMEKMMMLGLKPMRKMMGMHAVPTDKYRKISPVFIKNNILYPPITHPWLRIFPIGIKKDYISVSQGCEAL